MPVPERKGTNYSARKASVDPVSTDKATGGTERYVEKARSVEKDIVLDLQVKLDSARTQDEEYRKDREKYRRAYEMVSERSNRAGHSNVVVPLSISDVETQAAATLSNTFPDYSSIGTRPAEKTDRQQALAILGGVQHSCRQENFKWTYGNMLRTRGIEGQIIAKVVYAFSKRKRRVRYFNEAGEDTSTSCRPNALVLFNPVFDNGPDGYGYERVKDYWKEFSPMHNLGRDSPPTVVFLGTKDKLIPVGTAEKYKKLMEDVGARCDLHLYDNQPHGFFNKVKYYETLLETDKFLISIGYLQGEPTLRNK